MKQGIEKRKVSVYYLVLFSFFPSPLLDLEKGSRRGIRKKTKGKGGRTGLNIEGCVKGAQLSEGQRYAVVLSVIFGDT